MKRTDLCSMNISIDSLVILYFNMHNYKDLKDITNKEQDQQVTDNIFYEGVVSYKYIQVFKLSHHHYAIAKQQLQLSFTSCKLFCTAE